MPALTDSVVLSRLTSKLNQCPVPVILPELRDALVEMYDRTKLDRVNLSIDTIALEPYYTLPLAIDKVFVQVHELRVKKIQLHEKSEDHLDLEWTDIRASYPCGYHSFGGLDDPTWRTATATLPRFFYIEPDGRLRLVAIPDTLYTGDDAIKMRISQKPNRDTLTQIDNAHWLDYADTIVAGALSRLFLYVDRPWSDVKMAGFYGNQFDAGISDIKGEVSRSNNRNDRESYRTKAYA